MANETPAPALFKVQILERRKGERRHLYFLHEGKPCSLFDASSLMGLRSLQAGDHAVIAGRWSDAVVDVLEVENVVAIDKASHV